MLPPLWEELRSPQALAGWLFEEVGGEDWDAGPGPPVVLVPGLLSGDATLRTLAAFLRAHGYAPRPSQIRRNVACSDLAVERLAGRVERVAAAHGAPVALVGHSRGGLLARAVAQRRPEVVSGVVTLGSPHRDQLAVHPLLWAHLLLLGALGSLGLPGLLRLGCRGTGRCCRDFVAEVAAPLPSGIPGLSVFSRRDGIVEWQACVDPRGENREVAASHCGMPAHPEALAAVVSALRRFAPPVALAA